MVTEAIAAWHNGKGEPERVIHLALVVPDIRLWKLLKERAFVVKPPYGNTTVHLHVLVEDKRGLDWTIRQALVESGLVDPETAGLAYPDQVTLGWPTENT